MGKQKELTPEQHEVMRAFYLHQVSPERFSPLPKDTILKVIHQTKYTPSKSKMVILLNGLVVFKRASLEDMVEVLSTVFRTKWAKNHRWFYTYLATFWFVPSNTPLYDLVYLPPTSPEILDISSIIPTELAHPTLAIALALICVSHNLSNPVLLADIATDYTLTIATLVELISTTSPEGAKS